MTKDKKMRKSYLSTAIAAALGLLSTSSLVYAENQCIGHDNNNDVVESDTIAPVITDISFPEHINEGDVIALSAQTTVNTENGGKAALYWCVEQGTLDAFSTPSTLDEFGNPTTVDDELGNSTTLSSYEIVTFTAPPVPEEGAEIEVTVKLNDGLGGTDVKKINLKVDDTGNTEETDPAPELTVTLPDAIRANEINNVLIAVTDKTADDAENTDTLNTDIYLSIDEGDFEKVVKGLKGEKPDYEWTPSMTTDNARLMVVSTDGNKQSEFISDVFEITEAKRQDIILEPFDVDGEAIIGATIEIIINAEIIIIIDEDNDGKYEIPQVAEGDHTVKITKDDRIYPDADISVTASEEGDEKVEVTTTVPSKPAVEKVTFTPKDDKGELIIGATIEIIIDSKIVIVTDDDNDGSYIVEKLPEGDHNITITKDGYNYPSTVLTVDQNTTVTTTVTLETPPAFEPPEEGTDPNSITKEGLVIVGTYACDENTVSLVDPADGELFHSFNADIDARGLYLTAVDFDRDGLTDIATGGLGKGKDMLIYNTNRKAIGKIISNGDDKGVLIAFGDVDADDDFEILVTNQSKDTLVNLYESDGAAVRQLEILDEAKKVNIATGDINGDGKDELIVVLADKAKKDQDNVFIFDENGTLMDSFTATPNSKDAKGLVVTVADVNGDGKDEIIVGEASKKKYYGVSVYTAEGQLLTGFNAFSGDKEDKESKVKTKCKKSAYKGKGIILTSGDVDNDGKDDIIVTRAGYRNIKLFTGEGQLIDWFTATPEGYQITALSFGDKVAVEVPEVDEVPDNSEPLENITVIGQPDKPRPELDGHEIRGTVRVSNVLIIKVTIKVGARLVIGHGTRFKHRNAIPKGVKLGGMCNKRKKKYRKVQQKPHQAPIEVLDLSQPVVENEPPVMDDIKVLLGDNTSEATGRSGGIQVTQNPETGHIEVVEGDMRYEVMPVDMEQAAEDAEAGIYFDSNGTITLITRQGQAVTVQAVMQNMDGFVDGLDSEGELENLEIDADGQMRAYYQGVSNFYQVGRAHFFSGAVTDDSIPVGIHHSSVLFPEIHNRHILVFTTDAGEKRWQFILPTPADRSALLALAEEDSELDSITLHFDGAVGSVAGTVSFVINGEGHTGVFDYGVRQGALPESGGVEFNPVDDTRYEIVYPNGDRQYLFLLN